jgi:hypothetical protein
VRRRLDATTPAFAADSEVEALFTGFRGR